MNDTDSSDTEFYSGNFLALSTRCSNLHASSKRYDLDILRAHTYFDTSLSTSAPTFPNDRLIEFITIVLYAAVQGLLNAAVLAG